VSVPSYSRVWLHLVWATLERRPLLTKVAVAGLSIHLTRYANEKGIYMKINFVNPEHVHALVDLPIYLLELPAETFTIAFDGNNSDGQLNVPLDSSNAVAVAAGAYFNLALRNNGTVVGWGDNTYNQTNIPAGLSNVVGIAAGYYHGVAVLANGSVTNWGYYTGPMSGIDYYASVTNRASCSAPPTSGVVAVAAGAGQDLALMSNGTVVAWGYTNIKTKEWGHKTKEWGQKRKSGVTSQHINISTKEWGHISTY
jgi:hypothetical protein